MTLQLQLLLLILTQRLHFVTHPLNIASPKPTHFSHAASVVNWNAFTLLPSEDDGFWNDCGSASSNSTPTSSLTPASPEPHQFLASRKCLFDDLHINSSLDHFTHSMPSTSSNNRSPLPFYPRSPASAVKVDDDGWKNSPSNSQSRRRSRRRRSHKFDCAMMFEVEMDSSPTSSPIATSPPPLFASSPLQFSPAALSPTPPHRLQSFRPKQHQQPSTNELKQRIDKRLRSMIKKNRRHADLMEEVVKLEGLIRLEISKSLQLHQSGDRSGGFVWQNGQAGILKDFAAAICQYHELQLKGKFCICSCVQVNCRILFIIL